MPYQWSRAAVGGSRRWRAFLVPSCTDQVSTTGNSERILQSPIEEINICPNMELKVYDVLWGSNRYNH